MPWDQQCKNADGECEQILGLAFFTRKRLTKVTTSVLKADGVRQRSGSPLAISFGRRQMATSRTR
ncbi:hypothetical protein SMD20_35085 [Nonomuraea sp. LP-02]|nr:hypothetical protein [Nonomuraea sp. LP-02]MED7929512.1 hypothetical protein [Nonomuraea sp. LP-02]